MQQTGANRKTVCEDPKDEAAMYRKFLEEKQTD